MQLSEERKNKFYKTLIEIVEDRFDVKIDYKVVKEGEKNEKKKKEIKYKGN